MIPFLTDKNGNGLLHRAAQPRGIPNPENLEAQLQNLKMIVSAGTVCMREMKNIQRKTIMNYQYVNVNDNMNVPYAMLGCTSEYAANVLISGYDKWTVNLKLAYRNLIAKICEKNPNSTLAKNINLIQSNEPNAKKEEPSDKPKTSANPALDLFYGDDTSKLPSHLEFKTWYHPDICHFLLQTPNQPQCLVVQFQDSGYDNNTGTFKRQLETLIVLGNTLKVPAIFISKEPGADNHFVCGLVKENNLILINPLGMSQHEDMYKTLGELQKQQILNHVWLSTTHLQKYEYEEESLYSCGPISIEIALHLLQTFSLDKLNQFWATLKNEVQTSHPDTTGCVYSTISIDDFLSEDLVKLQVAEYKEKYQEQVLAIRKRHGEWLETLMNYRAEQANMTVKAYVEYCRESAPSQSVYNALLTQHLPADRIHELPAYAQLSNALTQPEKPIDLVKQLLLADKSIDKKKFILYVDALKAKEFSLDYYSFNEISKACDIPMYAWKYEYEADQKTIKKLEYMIKREQRDKAGRKDALIPINIVYYGLAQFEFIIPLQKGNSAFELYIEQDHKKIKNIYEHNILSVAVRTPSATKLLPYILKDLKYNDLVNEISDNFDHIDQGGKEKRVTPFLRFLKYTVDYYAELQALFKQANPTLKTPDELNKKVIEFVRENLKTLIAAGANHENLDDVYKVRVKALEDKLNHQEINKEIEGMIETRKKIVSSVTAAKTTPQEDTKKPDESVKSPEPKLSELPHLHQTKPEAPKQNNQPKKPEKKKPGKK